MTNPTFTLPAVKNNVTTPQLIGAIGAGDVSLALKTGHGASFPTILRGDCSSTGSSTVLNDTGALGSVAVGDFIYNLTDGSFAVVTSIAGAPNSVTTTALQGGSDNTWQSGDIWVIGMFIATLVQYDTDGVTVLKRERVRVTNRVTDTLTVQRGYDGDTALTFLADDYVQLLIEKSQLENLQKAVRHLIQRVEAAETLENTHYIAANKSTPQWLGTVSGTNTLTASGTPALTAYVAGQTYRFKVANNCTGAVTLNIDSLGAIAIKKIDGATALVSGDLKAGQTAEVVYDGTNFMLISPVGQASTTYLTTLKATTTQSSNADSGSYVSYGQTYDIPANSLAAGDTIDLWARGWVGGGARWVKVTLDGATIGDEIDLDDQVPYREHHWRIRIRSIGASGVCVCSYTVRRMNAGGTNPVRGTDDTSTTYTIDTTQDLTIDMWGKQDAGAEPDDYIEDLLIVKFAKP